MTEPDVQALIDRLMVEIASAKQSDGSVEQMWTRVKRDAPDVHAMMEAAIYPDGPLFRWWDDKPIQVLYASFRWRPCDHLPSAPKSPAFALPVAQP